MRNAGGVGGLAGAAKAAQGGLQMAKVGAQAAAPLMVALDAKFVGNLAGGIAYVSAKELGGQSEEDAANNAAIVNTVFTVATQLADGAQSAIRWTKQTLNHWYRQQAAVLDASLAYEFLGFTGPDAREGLTSHTEKRAPKWTGA